MSNHVKHLSVRNGTYYYSRRLPESVLVQREMHRAVFGGATHYRVSLGTKIQAEALARFSAADLAYREKVALVVPTRRDDMSAVDVPPPAAKRKLTSDILDQIEAELVRNTVARWRKKTVLAELGPELLDEFHREVDVREQDAEELRSILLDRKSSSDPRFPNIRDLAVHIASFNQLDVEGSGEAMALLMATVRKALLSGELAVDRMLQQGEGLLGELKRPQQQTSPKLSQIFADYARSTTRSRTVAEIQGTARRLIELVGDKQIHELNTSDIKGFFESEGLKTVGGKDPGSVQRPMSEATLRKKLALIRAAINLCIDRDLFAGPNPASKVNVAAFAQAISVHAMPAKRPFRVAELNEIFQHPWFTGCASENDTHAPGSHRLSGMHFWVPVFAALTGLRAGEIGGLKVSEILTDDAHPHIWVKPNEFRSTKNGQSRRVPILDCLFETGLADFVEAARRRNATRLFEDWERPRKGSPNAAEAAWSNGSLIRSFNRALIPNVLGAGVSGLVRRDVTFHSFRGAFKSMLGLHSHGLPLNYINEVIGHSKTELDQRYVGEIPIEETYPAMRACRFDGLILPNPPSLDA